MPSRYLIVGGLREDYCITHTNQALLGVLGGNAIYAAVGAAIWGAPVGIFSRVGSNYPTKWLENIRAAGIETAGVRVLPEPQDTRTFYKYLSLQDRVDTNPVAHFLRAGIPMPPALADYRSSTEGQENQVDFAPLAVRPTDLPEALDGTTASHLAPSDYLTHSLIPTRLRELGVKTVTVDPSIRYMQPDFRHKLRVLVSGLSGFLPSEAEARSYFQPRPPELWAMAEEFASFGCPVIVVKRGAAGQFLLDRNAGRHWIIPAFPAHVVDVTGAGDAYCGGFLAGLEQTGDPLEAAIRGGVSASLALEGHGPLYPMDAAPGLAAERAAALRPAVRLT
jgi:ribokinase